MSYLFIFNSEDRQRWPLPIYHGVIFTRALCYVSLLCALRFMSCNIWHSAGDVDSFNMFTYGFARI